MSGVLGTGRRRAASPTDSSTWPRRASDATHCGAAVLVALSALLVWLAVSLGGALTDQALGSSVSVRFAEWAREHGGSGIVNWVENEWYAHHPPPVGGRPPADAIRRPRPLPVVAAGPDHLPAPAAIRAAGQPGHPRRGAVVARRASGRRRSRRLRHHAPTGSHPHQLRGRRRLDGHQAAPGHALLGESDPRRRTVPPLRSRLPDGSKHTGGGLQCRLPHVLGQRRVLHRRPNRPSPADRGRVLRGLRRRGGHRRILGD